MLRRFAKLADRPGISDLRVVVQLANAGDPIATQVLTDGATILGRALGGLTSVFDPEVVIIAGGVSRSGRSFMTALKGAFRSELLPAPAATVRLVRARCGARAGVIGAGILALESVPDRATGVRDAFELRAS
jgi:glucokinase